MVAALATAMSLLQSSPSVAVRLWLEPRTLATLSLVSSFSVFDDGVRRAASAPPSARVYWFPVDSGGALSQRCELTLLSFGEFSAYARQAADPAVFVWLGGPTSPDQLPARPLAPPSTPLTDAGAQSQASGRSAGVQAEFRAGVLRRDGPVCVLCGKQWEQTQLQSLEAAHVIRHGSDDAVLDAAGLSSANDVHNGIALCGTPCHFWYDLFHWWVDDAGLVRATDALLADPALSGHFGRFVGQPLRIKPRFWPEPATWAIQRRLREQNTIARRAEAANQPFPCPNCDKRYARPYYLQRHVRHCLTPVARRRLFTPGAVSRTESSGSNSDTGSSDSSEGDGSGSSDGDGSGHSDGDGGASDSGSE